MNFDHLIWKNFPINLIIQNGLPSFLLCIFIRLKRSWICKPHMKVILQYIKRKFLNRYKRTFSKFGSSLKQDQLEFQSLNYDTKICNFVKLNLPVCFLSRIEMLVSIMCFVCFSPTIMFLQTYKKSTKVLNKCLANTLLSKYYKGLFIK